MFLFWILYKQIANDPKAYGLEHSDYTIAALVLYATDDQFFQSQN